MRPRTRERRNRPRFDVVGLLVGALEGWPSHRVRDLSASGALVESTCALPLGMRIAGSVAAGERRIPVRGTVKRVAAVAAVDEEDGAQSYRVGVEWESGDFPIHDANEGGTELERRGAPRPLERRRTVRYAVAGRSLEYTVAASVVVNDISASGVLCTSPIPVPTGTHARIRMRLSGADFLGDMVVRRLEPDAAKGWRLGARFGTLDDISRTRLVELLGGNSGV